MGNIMHKDKNRLRDRKVYCIKGLYCPENKIPLLSMKDFNRLYINFSKILLKTDNKEIGR